MPSTPNSPTKFIDTLTLPGDLRKLAPSRLEQVANELREELIDAISLTGGHFASSLGATEIAVAIHHAFDTPRDRVVWDVGHQAYVHKMLTGRRHLLGSLRKKDGISGFLKRSESEFDCFGGGHAGTSLSAAVGMAAALKRTEPSRKVIAVIGDASIVNGMAFEALNHAGDLNLDNLIVVLNDNKMSISTNVGAISRLLSSALTSAASTRLRVGIKKMFKAGYLPEVLFKAVGRAEEVTQGFFSSASMLFEAFGFRYIGPIDGNNIHSLLSALAHAKRQDVPVLIHANTIKGKGYEPAEQDPETWHGVVPFDRMRGEFLSASPRSARRKAPTFTQVFGDAVLDLARRDDKVVGITAAMAGGTGLDKLQAEKPQSFYDVGICEEHAVTFAAGLACEGHRPICAIYSTFMQRAFDQIMHDVCLQNLPVVFAMDRAGLVGADGETHHGIYDMSFLRALPNMTIMSPKDENELRQMVFTAIAHPGPTAIRYPRGTGSGVRVESNPARLPIGEAEIVNRGENALIISLGPVIQYAIAAAESLLQEHGISATVINARFAKPLDVTLLGAEIPKYQLVCTIEDHALSCGFGSSVIEMINEKRLRLQAPVKCFGVGDEFVKHASQEEQHEMCGYNSSAIVNHVLRHLKPVRIAAVG